MYRINLCDDAVMKIIVPLLPRECMKMESSP